MKHSFIAIRWCLAIAIPLVGLGIAPVTASPRDLPMNAMPATAGMQPGEGAPVIPTPLAPTAPGNTAAPPSPVTTPSTFDPNAIVPEPIVTSPEAREASSFIPEDKRPDDALLTPLAFAAAADDVLPSDAGTLVVSLAFNRSRALPGMEIVATLRLRARQAVDGIRVDLRLPAGLDHTQPGVPGATFDPATRVLSLDKLAVDKTGRADIDVPLIVSTKQPGKLTLEASVTVTGALAQLARVEAPAPVTLDIGQAATLGEIGPLGGTLALPDGLFVLRDAGSVEITFGPGALTASTVITGGLYLNLESINQPQAPDTQAPDTQAPDTQAPDNTLAASPKSVEDVIAQARRLAEDISEPREVTPGAVVASPLVFELYPEMAFAAPVTVTVPLSGLIAPQVLRAGMTPVLQYQRETEHTIMVDNADGTRSERRVKKITLEPVASWFDPLTHRLTARLNHFSTYPIGYQAPSGQPQPWKLAGLPGEVGLYRGSFNVQHPIDAPTLPDGLHPKLTLSYSSAAADAPRPADDNGQQDDHRLGHGWSLDVPKISRGVKLEKTSYGLGDNGWLLTASGDYYLNFDGQNHNLVLKSASANRSEFVTEGYLPLRVVQCRTGTDCDGLGLIVPTWNEGVHAPVGGHPCDTTVVMQPPAGQTYWQVFTPDGARYVFGIDAQSTRRQALRDSTPMVYSMWLLRRVYSLVRDNPAVAGRWTADYQYYSLTLRNGRAATRP